MLSWLEVIPNVVEASSGFKKPCVSDDFFKKSSDTHGFLKPELASTTLGMTHINAIALKLELASANVRYDFWPVVSQTIGRAIRGPEISRAA
jgi:hypothetical protein